jgi:Domain of unknown function (DUF4351)
MERWFERAVDAASLDAVFASPQSPPCLEELLRPEVFQQGAEKTQRTLLLRVLVRRFGTFAESVTQRVASASSEELDRWFDRAVDAASLNEVFATPPVMGA